MKKRALLAASFLSFGRLSFGGLLSAGLLFPSAARAGKPRIGRTEIFLRDGTSPLIAVPSTALAIKLVAEIFDVPVGARLVANWVIVKADGVRPNTPVSTLVIPITQANTNSATFSINNSGPWPVGEYRVDLMINDTPVTDVPYQVV